jgi:uncharacterized protein with FMN-binding domain
MSKRQPSLARRAFPALALTAVGVGMVQALDRPALSVGNGIGSPTSSDVANTTIAPVDTTATTLPASGSASVAGGVPTATVAPSATTVAPAATSAPATAAPTASDCGALTGTGAPGDITERRNYGTVTVTAKFTADGTLCSASATYNVYDQKSVRYEEYSIPILNKQAMSAKSANINGISGATAVSNGYRASLQSAIDNKH